MVHKRRDLEPIIKFQYLKNTLSGEAAELIKGIEISELNYALALSLLQKRYGDNKQSQTIDNSAILCIENGIFIYKINFNILTWILHTAHDSHPREFKTLPITLNCPKPLFTKL